MRSSGTSLPAALVTLILSWPVAAHTQQPPELIIRRTAIVNADRRLQGDIRVRDGRIAEIGPNLTATRGAREIDASGLLVLPGGIDPHVHIGRNRADNYTSASAAALAGGITTISNLASAASGEDLSAAIRREGELIRAEAIADVMLHPNITDAPNQHGQIAALPATGQTSVKVFMNRPAFDQNARDYLTGLQAAGQAGVLTMMHCEDDAILWNTAQRLIAEGRGSLRYFPESRPVLAEVVATRRAIAMSESTGAPIYIVHLSSEGALRVAEEAQRRGLPVFVETRPIYLNLTEERFQGEDRGLYIGQPPLRKKSDQDALWRGIAAGSVHVVGTDHVAYTKDEKLDPSQTVANHRAGLSNLQEMLPMLYSEGVRTGRITVEQMVAVISANPAKLFGLYPRKGTIAVGSDADLVLWDVNDTRTIRDADMLSRSGYSTYAGWSVTGWPRITIRRGEVVYEAGQIRGRAGSGQLVQRGRWQRP